MSNVSALLRNNHSATPARAQPLDVAPITFLRKDKGVGGPDKAIFSPVALAHELNDLFQNVGRYRFVYGGRPCTVQRFEDGVIDVIDRGNRFVEIENGAITAKYMPLGERDLSEFLKAAKLAQ